MAHGGSTIDPESSAPGAENAQAAPTTAASATAEPTTAEATTPPNGESRIPMALAVLALMALALATPSEVTLLPPWVPAVIEGVLLVALIVADPGKIDRQTRFTWWVSVLLIVALMISTLGSVAFLATNILQGSAATTQAVPLLIAGAKVWAGNNVAFALLYWQFDCGGPVARAHRMPRYPDFAFPQQQNPELARPGWRPWFPDYLYLAFTNANAFSPTDTLPMVTWAKVAMECQALLSFAILGLVIARAINVLN